MSRAHPAPPDSICILRLSAIGDCCHVVPVVRSLQAAFPKTRLTWIIGRTEHRLLEGLEGVEFIIFDKAAGLAGWLDVRRALAGRVFPVLLNLHASMRANLVSLAVTARRRIGFDSARARDYQWAFCNERIAAAEREHVGDALLGFARHLGAAPVIEWGIPVADEDRAFAAAAAAHGGPVCLVSPCSSERARNFRNWPVERYVEVLRWLHERFGARALITGAGTALERDYAERICTELNAGASGSQDIATDLVGKTTLKQLFALIQAVDVVLCPDSGPVHMATAAGTPVVGLYASSNPGRTGPYRDPHNLAVNRYPDAVQAAFGKPVEALRWGQRVREPDAMDRITTEDVREKLERALARPSSA